MHKLPEGVALGAIVRSGVSSDWMSASACIAAEAMTLAGGAAAIGLAARLGGSWGAVLLAGAAGTFIYLGYHALEGELHRRLGAKKTI